MSEGSLKTRTVTQLRHPLPQPGLSFERHLELVKAYSVLSKEGKDPVNYRDVGKTISPFKVSGNNKFFESIGILSRVEGQPGKYKPTDRAVDIYRDLVWNKEENVRTKIGELITSSWFWETTRNILTIQGKIKESELVQQLGREAGADPRLHTQSLKVVISYLRFSGLLVDNDGQLELNNSLSARTSIELKPQTPFNQEIIPKDAPRESKGAIDPAIFLGVLVTSETKDADIRRAVRAMLDEVEKFKHGKAESPDSFQSRE